MFNPNFINYKTLINTDNNFEISTNNRYKSSKSSFDILSNSKAKYSIDLTSADEPLATNKKYLNSSFDFLSKPSAMLFIIETDAL